MRIRALPGAIHLLHSYQILSTLYIVGGLRDLPLQPLPPEAHGWDALWLRRGPAGLTLVIWGSGSTELEQGGLYTLFPQSRTRIPRVPPPTLDRGCLSVAAGEGSYRSTGARGETGPSAQWYLVIVECRSSQDIGFKLAGSVHDVGSVGRDHTHARAHRALSCLPFLLHTTTLRILNTMATANVPNGFLGNLSSDQELKLQQLWSVLLKALDAWTGDENSVNQRKPSISRTDTNASARASTASSRIDSSKLAQTLQGSGLDATQIRTVHQSLANLDAEELHRGFLASIKNENPDVLMLRFLRARKWDVGNAFAMMIGSVEWRIKEMNVDDVLAKGELHALKQSKESKNASEKKDGTMFLAQSRMGKAFVRGTDKVGRPIVVVQVRLHKPGEQSEEVLNQFIVHVIEAVRLLLRPPVETAVSFDIRFALQRFLADITR